MYVRVRGGESGRERGRKESKAESCMMRLSLCLAALALAVARDGSSGGVLRLAIIEEGGVSRSVFIGPEIPQFYNE